MAINRLSTAGLTLSWASESTAGTRPTTGYTKVPEIKDTPSFNPEPNWIDVTPLTELESLQYIPGLKDFGGGFTFTANMNPTLLTAWNTTLMTAYETAKASGRAVWFCVSHPDLTGDSDAVYWPGIPVKCSFNESSVNAALETSLFVGQAGPTEHGAPPTFVSA